MVFILYYLNGPAEQHLLATAYHHNVFSHKSQVLDHASAEGSQHCTSCSKLIAARSVKKEEKSGVCIIASKAILLGISHIYGRSFSLQPIKARELP